MRRVVLCAVTVAVAVAPSRWVPSFAQGKQANWFADGGDPQRSSWQRDETLITPETVKGMKLLWTLQTDNQPRQLHNLFAPLIVSDVATARGPREIAVLAGVSDNIYGIDVEKGTQIWKRHFDSTFQEPAGGRGGGPLCPGGLTATPVVAPMETPGEYKIYAISWDGRLRQLDVATGEDLAPAEPFLPANGKPYALNLVNNVLYTTTAQGCGGNPEPVLRLRSRDEEGRQLQSRKRRPVAATRALRRQGRHRLRRQRRWRLLPRAADLRTGDRLGEAEPGDESARAQGLVRAVECVLAAQARPRYERDRAGLRLQGQGIHRPVEQGVPDLAARHARARRRGSSHAGLPHAARLQRGSAVRRRGDLGCALDLGGRRAARAGS